MFIKDTQRLLLLQRLSKELGTGKKMTLSHLDSHALCAVLDFEGSLESDG